MREKRFFSIVRRIRTVLLLWAGVSILVFLMTVAWDMIANLREPRRSAREGAGR